VGLGQAREDGHAARRKLDQRLAPARPETGFALAPAAGICGVALLDLGVAQAFEHAEVALAQLGEGAQRQAAGRRHRRAGVAGAQAVAALRSAASYDPVAFLDDDKSLRGSFVAGLEVHPPGALQTLINEESAQVVLLRFFGGLQMPEIAQMLDISLPTAERDWRFARAWLQDRIGETKGVDD
jgi:hypothetical protein